MSNIAAYLLDNPLVDEATVRGASEGELVATFHLIREEQIRRALESNDPVQVGESAIEDLMARPQLSEVKPYLHNGLLVCPGLKVEKSRTSHECVFTALEEGWVWESPDCLFDDMRQLPGQKVVRCAVTVVPAVEGLKLDVVRSKASGTSKCQMQKVRSFEVRHGALVETKARTRSTTSSHR